MIVLLLLMTKQQNLFVCRARGLGLQGSIPGLTAIISEIGYILLPSRNMAEILLKLRKSSKQPTPYMKTIELTFALKL